MLCSETGRLIPAFRVYLASRISLKTHAVTETFQLFVSRRESLQSPPTRLNASIERVKEKRRTTLYRLIFCGILSTGIGIIQLHPPMRWIFPYNKLLCACYRVISPQCLVTVVFIPVPDADKILLRLTFIYVVRG